MVIVDTSVIFKWFDTSEDNREQAIDLLIQHLSNKEVITTSDLLLYEITNAWSTKSKLPNSRIRMNLTRLEKYALNIAAVNFRLLDKAFTLSRKYSISVYDASYAVLAQEKQCIFITADRKLVEKLNLSFIKLL